MSKFTIHTQETAPEAAKESLGKVAERFGGMLPNLYGLMANAPAALRGYMAVSGEFMKSSFSPAEQQLLMLSVSTENGCDYCVAAHTMGAKRAKLGDDVIAALRDGKPIADARLQALHSFCQTVVQKRGWLDESDVDAFLDAGFTQENVFEVVLAVGMKTISNYINHIGHTPLDKAFEPVKWTKAA